VTYYGYDADNRLLYKNYSDTTTMRACYAYDGQDGWGNTMINPVGHLTSSFGITHSGTVVSGSESWAWDSMGRLQAEMQCTPSTCGASKGYDVYATYDLMGNQTSVWDSSVALYPTYDGANRLAGMTANLNAEPGTPGPGSQTLISISAHSPFGGLTNAALGNGLAETRGYNSRGWLGSIADGSVYSLSLTYYGNGSVNTANDSDNGNWTYHYDSLDRISTASMTGQSFTYSPDQYGNMTCTYSGSKPCTPLGLTFNAANNRINDGTHTYDADGNLTADGTHGYVYDAENRITCVVDPNGGLCTTGGATVYYYDPDGRRVAKDTGTGTVIEEYVYDLKGDQSSAHDGSGTLLRAELYDPDGRHVATWKSSALTYNLADWLGTERVRTNSSGTACETSTDTPYGMNLTFSGSCDASPMHFTGKQLDSETNNTYFGARYYATSANLARFMTPDWSAEASPVPYAKLDNPQTLNLYVYLRNNPLNTVDPDGHGQTGTPTSDCTNNGNGTACSKLGGIKKAWLDTIEVSGSIGLGVGATFQFGTAQGSAQLGVRVESTTGLGFDNGKDEAFGGGEVKGKVSENVEGGVKVGVTGSKEGVTPSAEANIKVGPVEGGIKADSSGVHPTGLSSATTSDSKLGSHVQGIVGVGVAVNFSQAGRALDATESAIGQFWSDFMTGKITP